MFKLLERKFEHLNPFKPNGISGQVHFWVVGVLLFFFIFIQNFNRTFSKQTVDTLIRSRIMSLCCCIMWCLNWVCIVCLCHIKMTQGHDVSK